MRAEERARRSAYQGISWKDIRTSVDQETPSRSRMGGQIIRVQQTGSCLSCCPRHPETMRMRADRPTKVPGTLTPSGFLAPSPRAHFRGSDAACDVRGVQHAAV